MHPQADEKKISQWEKRQAELVEAIEHLEHELEEVKQLQSETPSHIPWNELPEDAQFKQLAPRPETFAGHGEDDCVPSGDGDRTETMASRFREGGYGYGVAKKELTEKCLDFFGHARERREELARRPDDIVDILKNGADRARKVARATLKRAYRRVGLSSYRF